MVTITASKSSPSVTFTMDASVSSQSVAGNYSRIVAYLKATKGTGSNFLGDGVQIATIDGVGEMGRHSAKPFLPTGSTGWTVGPFYLDVPHNADGSRGNITLRMTLDYGNVNSSHTAALALPTIPRATQPSMTPNPADAGSPTTIGLPRASAGFTHDLVYAFGGLTAQPITTGAATSHDWTPPLSLLELIPNAASGPLQITATTKSGATTIGSKQVAGTLRAPASVVPTVTGISATDQNSDVATAVGAFVQSLSRPTFAVAASGVYGSTIASREVTVQDTVVAEGSAITLTQAGNIPVTGRATDSRGRVGTGAGTLTVLAYSPPVASAYQARRCDSGGALLDDGAYLRVDLTAAIASLMNGTQRNLLTIRAFTRPRGGSVWTPRNVLTPGGTTYNAWFLVSGGAIFAPTGSWDVRVQVHDRFGVYVADTIVSTAAVALDMNGTKVGIGKVHEQGALDVAGQIFQAGLPVVDSGDIATDTDRGLIELATIAEVKAGADTSRAVTPAALTAALALPPTQTLYGPDSTTVTAAAATWQDAGAMWEITPERALEVLVHFGVNTGGNGTNLYGMIGVQAAGALVLEPEYDQADGVLRFALTAFSISGGPTTVAGVKRFILPAGVKTSLHLRKRRNLTSAAPPFNYSYMTIEPKRWVP